MSSQISAPEEQKRFARISALREWLSRRALCIPPEGLAKPGLKVILGYCFLIFFIAAGVRVLHWQDSHVWIAAGQTSLAGVYNRYLKEAERMIEDRSILFPREPPAEGNARMLVHPPGYSILLAAILKFSDNPYPALWLIQIVGDAIAAALVFLIASEFLPLTAALISGLLVALSPHLAFYSLILSPDSLPVLPILLAVYLIIQATKRPRLLPVILAGVLIGLSCWLRANGLALVPVLGLLVFLLLERRRRWRYAFVLLLAAVVTIAPITIRNLLVFHRFIPVSIAAGLNLAEGIGNYDPEGELGMPRSDREARLKDVEWSGRADYGNSLWFPDGIERDRVRWNRGMEVIRSHPAWFFGVMLRRAGFMLRYNDSQSLGFPFNTASVPVIESERGFAHPISIADQEHSQQMKLPVIVSFNGAIISHGVAISDGAQPVWSNSPEELMAQGTRLSPQGSAALIDGGQALEIASAASTYDEQFVSAPIAVEKNTDYVLVLPVRLALGDMAIRVTSADRRITLASAILSTAQNQPKVDPDESLEPPPLSGFSTAIQLPFATGNRTQIRFILSNNTSTPTSSIARVGSAALFQMGATPATWTRVPRKLVRGIQRNLFTTNHLLPLVSIGLVLLLLAGQGRVILIVLAVPLYYLSAHSVLSTEYRYILGIHYFLFILAGVALAAFIQAVWTGARLIASSAKGKDS